MRGGNPNWRKGVSANPGGRVGVPKDIREAAQRHCPAAIETLAEIVRDAEAPAAARVSAASVLLDRGYGKAPQTINASVARTVHEISDDELLAIATGRGRSALEEEAAQDDEPDPSRLN